MSPFLDTIEHFVLSCSATEVRDKFWTSILRNPNFSTEELLYILLARVQNLTTNCPDIEDDVYTFINICAKYLRGTARIFFSQDD